MVAEQMQPWLNRGEDLVDLRLSRVRSAAARKRTKGLCGFVRQQNIDQAAQRRSTE